MHGVVFAILVRPLPCAAEGALRRLSRRRRLAECKRQQTGTQQHEAGRGQCEESVRDQIVVAHDTPATLDARPNLLKLYESPAAKEVMRLSARGQCLRQDQKFRPGNDNPQRHGPGKSQRSPGP